MKYHALFVIFEKWQNLKLSSAASCRRHLRVKSGHNGEHIIDPDKNYEDKIVIIFFPVNLKICFGCSKEPSH